MGQKKLIRKIFGHYLYVFVVLSIVDELFAPFLKS